MNPILGSKGFHNIPQSSIVPHVPSEFCILAKYTKVALVPLLPPHSSKAVSFLPGEEKETVNLCLERVKELLS